MFATVDYFEVTPRDAEVPDYGEDFCLDALSRVSSDDDSRELMKYGVPQDPKSTGENFHLCFTFRSGQNIRIGAESVSLKIKNID